MKSPAERGFSGFTSGPSVGLVSTARERVEKALAMAFRGRKERKRQFRQLWITRINAAARLHGLSYSRLINGLNKAEIEVDRKVLADIAVHDASDFSRLVETAKAAL